MARDNQDDIPEADRAPDCPHPRETYDLIGHQDAEKRFLSAYNSGRMHHAWLITGPPGSGKATLAYRIIRFILGGQSLLENSLDIPKSDPVAQRIESLGHGDFFLLRRPYNHKTKKLRAEIPVDRTRDLRDFYAQKPAEGGWRVCVIDSADELNKNAENGVLKTLEEPPNKSLIILLSHSPGRLLPTIRSRCMNLPLRAVPHDDIRAWLSDKVDAKPDIIDAAVKLSRGGPGKAIALARNADKVLAPLTRFISSLERADTKLDQTISNMLAMPNASASRELFWDCLQDILQMQSAFSLTGEWEGAFRPLPVQKSPESWQRLWDKAGEMKHLEGALNMDKKTVMLDTLSAIRHG